MGAEHVSSAVSMRLPASARCLLLVLRLAIASASHEGNQRQIDLGAEQFAPGALKAQLLAGYDKAMRPSEYLARMRGERFAPPEAVDVQMYVESIPYVNQIEQTYALDGYFRAWWHDPRLNYSGLDSRAELVLSSADEIWRPDLYFELAEAILLSSPTLSGQSLFVYPDGTVWWSRQARLQLRCCMKFAKMPFDKQRCPVRLGLYSQTASEAVLHWRATGLQAIVGRVRDTWRAINVTQVRSPHDLPMISP